MIDFNACALAARERVDAAVFKARCYAAAAEARAAVAAYLGGVEARHAAYAGS